MAALNFRGTLEMRKWFDVNDKIWLKLYYLLCMWWVWLAFWSSSDVSVERQHRHSRWEARHYPGWLLDFTFLITDSMILCSVTSAVSMTCCCIFGLDAGSNISLGYFAPRSTHPSIPLGSVNEYQLRLGRQRQVWLIPIADERVDVQVKLWKPLRTRAIPERFCGGDSLRRGAISNVCTFTL